jgi:hypothetical protein
MTERQSFSYFDLLGKRIRWSLEEQGILIEIAGSVPELRLYSDVRSISIEEADHEHFIGVTFRDGARRGLCSRPNNGENPPAAYDLFLRDLHGRLAPYSEQIQVRRGLRGKVLLGLPVVGVALWGAFRPALLRNSNFQLFAAVVLGASIFLAALRMRRLTLADLSGSRTVGRQVLSSLWGRLAYLAALGVLCWLLYRSV